MGKTVAVTGNQGVAHGFRQIEPHVVAAYPITPSTDIVEEVAQYCSDGKMRTEFVPVESEHSAMSACIGASAAGARVMTATSSQGLALMWEMLYIAAGLRLPIVLADVNRALSAPLNIHGDHSDSMGARDAGWIQLYCKNAQEAYDTIIQAVRIAEHPEINLPVMVCYDGFIVSHCLARMEINDDDAVKQFVGERVPVNPLLDVKKPVSYGPIVMFDYYYELRQHLTETMKKVPAVVQSVANEYAGQFGRQYDLIETYKLEDADMAIVAMNSIVSTAEPVVDDLRARGYKVGLLRPRMFRPFPAKEIVDALSGVKAIAVMDRAQAPGGITGPLANEIRSAFYEADKRPKLMSVTYGLGGRDVKPWEVESVFAKLEKIVETGRVDEPEIYLGLRGGNGNGSNA
jgi:pyruvate ferredoxin oxidoreductase alpha subunit